MAFNVVGIGEVLWDVFPAGRQLGGAPANFAHHARELGARAQVVTRVGDDSLGREVMRRFEAMDLPVETVQVDGENPTGTVTVVLAGEGVPRFTFAAGAAWDRLMATPSALQAVTTADAICFGSLAQRHPVSRSTIRQLVAAAPAAALRLFDINLRQQFYSREVIERSLGLANVLKLNDDELSILAGMFSLSGDLRQRIERLVTMFEMKGVALTQGAAGSLLYYAGQWSVQSPQPVQVVDTVGAGDAFTAALTLGLLHARTLDEVHAMAANVARYVCSCAGATPILPQNLKSQACG